MYRRLGSATLSQLAFPGEGNTNFPWKKSYWDNTVVKRLKMEWQALLGWNGEPIGCGKDLRSSSSAQPSSLFHLLASLEDSSSFHTASPLFLSPCQGVWVNPSDVGKCFFSRSVLFPLSFDSKSWNQFLNRPSQPFLPLSLSRCMEDLLDVGECFISRSALTLFPLIASLENNPWFDTQIALSLSPLLASLENNPWFDTQLLFPSLPY